MSDDSFKVLFETIKRTLNAEKVYFELAAVKFDEGYLVVKFVRCDPDAVENVVNYVLSGTSDVTWRTEDTPGTFSVRVDPVDVVAQGIPFSSPDEARGTEPIELAQLFVRAEISKREPQLADYTTYLPFFAYILGGWKATVSTSIADGRYYEVTYNKEADEFYVDTYIKQQNTVYNNAQEAQA